jgi:hypothetical protein
MDTRITVERLTWAGDTFTKKDVFTFAAIDQRVLAHFFACLPNRFTRLITPRARAMNNDGPLRRVLRRRSHRLISAARCASYAAGRIR